MDAATDTAPVSLDRPWLDERRTYVARASVERFIVPLLAAEIERAIAQHARRGSAVLDVGCGRQPFRTQLEALGLAYTGLDTQQNEDGSVHVVSPIDGPLPAELVTRGPFGLILCTEVLEHVAGWDAALCNMRSLLAPGGRAILTCPHVFPLHEEPYDFWRPTTHALRHRCEAAGLRVVELKRLGSGLDVLGTVLGGMSIKRSKALPGLVGAPLAQAARWTRDLAFWLVSRRALRRAIELRDHQYLSNFAVVERP